MTETKEYDWMEEARELAAQCWCDEETKYTIMDPVLAEAVAKRIAFWMEEAARNGRNTEYYRGLVEKCGETIGQGARIADDGSRSQDVLCAKVPELVAAIMDHYNDLIGSVESKHEGETRHEAAKRYITVKESGTNELLASIDTQEGAAICKDGVVVEADN